MTTHQVVVKKQNGAFCKANVFEPYDSPDWVKIPEGHQLAYVEQGGINLVGFVTCPVQAGVSRFIAA
jgi:hypothetical protein